MLKKLRSFLTVSKYNNNKPFSCYQVGLATLKKYLYWQTIDLQILLNGFALSFGLPLPLAIWIPSIYLFSLLGCPQIFSTHPLTVSKYLYIIMILPPWITIDAWGWEDFVLFILLLKPIFDYMHLLLRKLQKKEFFVKIFIT